MIHEHPPQDDLESGLKAPCLTIVFDPQPLLFLLGDPVDEVLLVKSIAFVDGDVDAETCELLLPSFSPAISPTAGESVLKLMLVKRRVARWFVVSYIDVVFVTRGMPSFAGEGFVHFKFPELLVLMSIVPAYQNACVLTF